MMGLAGQFRMIACDKCGLIRQDPRLIWSCLSRYYPAEYTAYAGYMGERSRLRRLDQGYGLWKRLRAVEQYQRGGHLLDVGCGTGAFLHEAKRTGRWDVTGIEPNEVAVNEARRVTGATVFSGQFSQFVLPHDQFDVITMWTVLEHLADPISDLRRCRDLLRDRGWLIFSLPNLEGIEARMFGSSWAGWDLPRHLHVFPRKLLKTILERMGFRLVAARCVSSSYAALGHTLGFWSRPWGAHYPLLRRALVGTYGLLPVRIALGVPLWLADRLQASSIITFFAQKSDMAGA